MSDVDDFLNNAHDEVDALMGTSVMTIGTTTCPVVWNTHTLELDGVLGGLENQKSGRATAQPSDVTNPTSWENLRCSIGTEPFRIDRVEVGTVAVHFDLVGEDE